jgi:predicted dehydrogenase
VGPENVDGLLVASTHATHFDISSAALKAGVNVFCEKPMCTDPDEAWELSSIAKDSGLLFMVNNTANWRDNTRRATEIVQRGIDNAGVGEVEHVNCYMGSPLLWLFDDPSNIGWTKPSGTMTGNGFGWGQLSHTLAWVYQVTGLTPKSVFANMHFSKRSGADLYDSATILCTNGATVSVQGVATLPGKNPVASKQITNQVFGSEGFIEYSGDDQDPLSGNLLLRRHDGHTETHEGFLFENYEDTGMGPESLCAFVDGCRGDTGVWNGCDADIGVRTVVTIDAMYKSAATGLAITV